MFRTLCKCVGSITKWLSEYDLRDSVLIDFDRNSFQYWYSLYRMINIHENNLSLAKLQLDAVIKANVHKSVALTGRMLIFVGVFISPLYRKREWMKECSFAIQFFCSLSIHDCIDERNVEKHSSWQLESVLFPITNVIDS